MGGVVTIEESVEVAPVVDSVKVVTVNPVEKAGSKKRQRKCECVGCGSIDCKICKYCLDLKKYGGQGKLKQKCIERRCVVKTVKKRKIGGGTE